MTLQEVIESRHPAYLQQTIQTLLLLHQIKRLNEHQWTALHYMQFCELLASDER